jgi:putative 3-demethylubiquinone-9 3-methyltransferase
VRTQITAAKSNKAASQWCDGFTEADSGFVDLLNNATALNFKPADELAAIAKACPKKKEFAEAFRDAPSPAFTGNVPDCTLSGGNVTMTGELTITDTTLSNLGPMNVTVNIFLTAGEPSDSDTPAGTATFTIPAGGKGTFTQTLPSGGLTTGKCSFRATNLWPKGL